MALRHLHCTDELFILKESFVNNSMRGGAPKGQVMCCAPCVHMCQAGKAILEHTSEPAASVLRGKDYDIQYVKEFNNAFKPPEKSNVHMVWTSAYGCSLKLYYACLLQPANTVHTRMRDLEGLRRGFG